MFHTRERKCFAGLVLFQAKESRFVGLGPTNHDDVVSREREKGAAQHSSSDAQRGEREREVPSSPIPPPQPLQLLHHLPPNNDHSTAASQARGRLA